MEKDTLLERVRAAEGGVADAESDLAELLREVELAPRAEKTTISERLRHAIQKLRDARAHLGALGQSVGAEDE